MLPLPLPRYEMNHAHWVPIPLKIDGEDRVYEELERLQKGGVEHRVFRYRRSNGNSWLMVEKKVVFVN